MSGQLDPHDRNTTQRRAGTLASKLVAGAATLAAGLFATAALAAGSFTDAAGDSTPALDIASATVSESPEGLLTGVALGNRVAIGESPGGGLGENRRVGLPPSSDAWSTSPPGPSILTDAIGDVPLAPDLTGVKVSDGKDGTVRFNDPRVGHGRAARKGDPARDRPRSPG